MFLYKAMVIQLDFNSQVCNNTYRLTKKEKKSNRTQLGFLDEKQYSRNLNVLMCTKSWPNGPKMLTWRAQNLKVEKLSDEEVRMSDLYMKYCHENRG